MVTVERLIKEEKDSDEARSENSVQLLSAFREQPAWVLLGEPGAGKSTSLKQEAESCGEDHYYLSIAEFIYDFPEDELRGKTLFLDGLDEIRASSKDGTILLQVKTKLRALDNPKFRLACRAADWFGTSDSDDIKSVSQSKEIIQLQLIPLEQDDILSILSKNFNVEDPESFSDKAERLGVYHLLENPQTLELLVKAVKDNQWPNSRSETYQLACEKLVDESNPRHRNINRSSSISKEQLLDVAGQLFATMLLADKEGVALDQDSATQRFPYLDDYLPSARDAAYEAVHRNLFRLEGDERFKPAHRSIAEYLAAIWLAKQIDQNGLPLARALNLLIGRDSRAVSGLRGLYGWLAIQCKTARTRLIQADALTVVAYGDAKPLPEVDKRNILSGLQKEAEELATFHQDIRPATPFGALADKALLGGFAEALSTSSRDHATQSYVDCLLTILQEGEPMLQLSDLVFNIVKDETWWDVVRKEALRTWLSIQKSPSKAHALLDDINRNFVRDSEDELAGILLRYLYPNHISVTDLFQYLHIPKNDHLMGMYVRFWEHDFTEKGPEKVLPAVLDQLIRDPNAVEVSKKNFHLKRMISRLVSRCVVSYGDKVTDKTLYHWLKLGVGKYYDSNLEDSDRKAINEWLETRPNRYKGLVRYFVENCAGKKDISMYKFWELVQGTVVPDDFGVWCLEQASNTDNEVVANLYIYEVMNALKQQRGNYGLSLEKVEEWAKDRESRQQLLETFLVTSIEGWRSEQAERRQKNKEARDAQRQERTKQLAKYMASVKQGNANVQIMHQLAGVWWNRYTDIHGETLEERFNDFSENGSELLDAAKQGFIASPERDDLPSVDEITDLSVKNKEHFIRRPCLVGMEIRWELGESAITSLSDESLKRMVAFRITYGYDNTPDWFVFLVKIRPDLVADVYIPYVVASLKAKKNHVDLLYALEHDPDYEMLACRVVPTLLDKFPLRAKVEQLYCLEYLLKAALRYKLYELPLTVKNKLSKKSLESSQKVYWLATGMLIDQGLYESQLWEFVNDSQTRLNFLSGFLSSRFGELEQRYELSAYTTGKLIEQLLPHAELDWSKGNGTVTPAMHRGDHIRELVRRLANSERPEAEAEVERLLREPSLEKLKFSLEDARHQIRQRQREASFSFLSLSEVANVLMNQAPSNIADMTSLVLFHLDDIANEIRHDNDDGFSKFWNIDKYRKPESKRVENACRDELLSRLKSKLSSFGVDCQSEADYSNDKRADIRISYRNEFELPIEIKRDDNSSLWDAAQSQLVKQYSISPKAHGHGIYLVLWFGAGDVAKPRDEGKKPKSPDELQLRLTAMLDAEDHDRIFVRVLDVGWS